MSSDIIAARRQHIQDSAPCVGCGATLAACKVARGKDPTAPAWFGCCAQGLDFRPCVHKVDASALVALLAEVESGTVRTVEEVTPPSAPAKTFMSWFEYLNQGDRWQPNGKPMVAIADMDPEWRYNAARWLESGCVMIGRRYSLAAHLWLAAQLGSPLGPSENAADSLERDIERQSAEIDRDPLAWIRTTKLHGALVGGLPTKPKEVEKLAERARHWSKCPARTGAGGCRCEQIRAEREAATDTTPEWTI